MNTTRNMLFVVVVVVAVEKAFVAKSKLVLKRENTTRNMLVVFAVVVEKAFFAKSKLVLKRVNTTRNMLVVIVVVVAEKDIFAKGARVLKRRP